MSKLVKWGIVLGLVVVGGLVLSYFCPVCGNYLAAVMNLGAKLLSFVDVGSWMGTVGGWFHSILDLFK